MNVAQQFVRQTVWLGRSSKALASARFYPAAIVRSLHISQNELKLGLLHSNSFKFTHSCRQLSSTESCKFEVINIQDEDDFKKKVLESNIPVIVDFHATWCGPCKLLGPRLEKLLSEEKGKVIMAKVDIDENSDLALEYGVRSVPTVIGMKDGKVQGQFIGLIDDDRIQTFVDKLIIC